MTYTSARLYMTAGGQAPKSDLANQVNANFDVLKGIEDDYINVSGSMAITSGGSLGDGALSGYYRRIKGRIHGYGGFVLGTTSTITGPLVISGLHPAAPTDASLAPMTVVLYRLATGRRYIGVGKITNTGVATLNWNGPQNLNGGIPFTWANNCSIRWSYEARAGEIQTALR